MRCAIKLSFSVQGLVHAVLMNFLKILFSKVKLIFITQNNRAKSQTNNYCSLFLFQVSVTDLVVF